MNPNQITIAIALVTNLRMVHKVATFDRPAPDQHEAFAAGVAGYALNTLKEIVAEDVEHMLNESFIPLLEQDVELVQTIHTKFRDLFKIDVAPAEIEVV